MIRLIFNILFFVLSVATMYSVYQSTKLSRDFSIETAVDIEGDLDTVYQLIAVSTNWSQWEPWRAVDPKFALYFDGPPSGTGARMQWTSKRRGSGLIWWGSKDLYSPEQIAAIRDEPVTVGWVMDVRDFGGRWNCVFQVQRDSFEDNLIHLTWTISGKRVPLERPFWFLFSLDEIIRTDMEAGLAKIKKIVESA